MRALILCAGLGKRLGNRANGVPKPLIEFNGRPCVLYQLLKLQKLGVSEVIINTHLNLHMFSSTLSKFNLDIKVIFSEESKLLGTLGTLRKHLSWLSNEDFWVLHGDNLFMDNLSSMARDVKNSDEDLLGAMGVFKTLNYRKVGIVKMDSQNRLIALHEKSHRRRGYLANSAIYLFRPAVASLIDELPNESTDISSHFLPRAYGKLLISKLKGKFIDIGTPRDLKRARDKAYLFN